MAKGKSAEELPKQIAEAVAKAMPKPPDQPQTPPATKEEIAEMAGKAASEAAARVVEAKAKEDSEQRRHGELLSAIRSRAVAQQAAGYKDDSYRLVGQGLSALAGAMERKEPVKIVLENVPQLLYGPSPPSPKEVPPEAAGAETATKIRPEWIVEE